MASTLRLGLPRAASSLTTTAHPHPATTTLTTPLTSIPPTRTSLVAPNPSLLRSKHRAAYPRQGIPQDQHGAELPIPAPYAKTPHIPEYPYGPRRIYKQSNTGLYAQARIQFGNKVAEKHKNKSLRTWRPNVMRRRLFSFALNCWVQTRVTGRVLRTIDKVGGLDEYLLGEKTQRIKDLGPWGWKLRWRIMQSEVVRERFQLERERLGLAPSLDPLDDLDAEFLDVMGEKETADAAGEPVSAQREALMGQMDAMLASGAEFDFASNTPDQFAEKVLKEVAREQGPEKGIKENVDKFANKAIGKAVAEAKGAEEDTMLEEKHAEKAAKDRAAGDAAKKVI